MRVGGHIFKEDCHLDWCECSHAFSWYPLRLSYSSQLKGPP